MSPGGMDMGGTTMLPPIGGLRWITSWHVQAGALVPLVVVLAAYLWGAARVGRAHPAGRWPLRHTALFTAGLAVIAVATMGSIGVYDDTLMWVHMLQHLALIMVAPALLVSGRPIILAMHATRNPVHTAIKRVLRSPVVGVITSPIGAGAIYAATIVGTHLTGLAGVFMGSTSGRVGEHLLYLVAGYLYFLPIFGDEPIRHRPSHVGRLALLLLTMPVDTFTGIALMMYTRPPGGMHMAPRDWGPSALSDAHTAGGTMWVVGDGLMLGLVLIAFILWSRDSTLRGRSGLGWLERAREQTLASRATEGAAAGTGRSPSADSDDALAAYNAWLARLEQAEHQPQRADKAR
ncbi:MAG: cytochrome c oxidase assembly protein [Mycobacteriales bacterium]